MRMCRRRAAPWGERGARIVSISPGLIISPQGVSENKAQPMRRAMLQRIPLQREGTLIEIADAVEFLTSARASYVTGTDLLVDGGIVAAGMT
jgi:NAD(P)-dependent dehydrogenase (short-subunit alcohol dehydrogenase family)